MQIYFINLDEGKYKKIKSSKKLDFNDEVSEFVFKTRRPLTRNSKKLQGLDVELEKAGEISKYYEEPMDFSSPMLEDDRNGVFHTQREKRSYEGMKEKLRLANLQIARLEKKVREHVVEKINFDRIKALWELERVSKPEIVSTEAQFFTWTLPAIKEAKFVRRINVNLRATNRRLKRHIEYLEIQLENSEEGQPQQK